MITAEALKESARKLEAELWKASQTSTEATILLQQIAPFIAEAYSVTSISTFPFRRLRFDHPFIEGSLADNVQLSNAYANFANQFEGLEP